jgi:hypothetical protein
MKKSMLSAWAILLFSVATNATISSNGGEDRYVLTRNAAVRISVDSGWPRGCLTPVRIDIPGLHLDLWIDGEGRVFNEVRLDSGKIDETQDFGHELFRLDIANGKLHAGGQTLNGRIYEQNALRTRLRLPKVEMALLLNIVKDLAVLDINGIIIPVRVHAGWEVSGMRELEIGLRGGRGEGRFFLDAGQGRLFFEDGNALPSAGKPRANRVCWAVKQK